MLYAFFRVIPRRLNVKCRRFGTLCSIFLDLHIRLEYVTGCSETSAYKIQPPGYYPEESIQQHKYLSPLYHVRKGSALPHPQKAICLSSFTCYCPVCVCFQDSCCYWRPMICSACILLCVQFPAEL